MDQILLTEIEERISPLLNAEGIELIELTIRRQSGKAYLQFLVDNAKGITLDECSQLNRKIGEVLDQENIFSQSYVLEVSSPGLDRPFKTTRDFQRYVGRMVKLALRQEVNGRNVWIGILEKANDSYVIIRLESGENIRIQREDIAWAKLEVRV